MKTDNLIVRMDYAKKQKLINKAEDQGVTLSKHVTDLIDKVSIQLSSGNKKSDPQVVKTAEMLEDALRLLTKIKKIELAKTVEGNWTAERKAFEYAKAILGFADNMVNNKPLDATLRAIRQVKLNQSIIKRER